ncbi:MAG TPA: hypothetical protein H9902_13585 [Candidatus Stackebrandtia faecavium]|nr:hypothetical protein [Candidatus Stackebrandtia faecavium]
MIVRAQLFDMDSAFIRATFDLFARPRECPGCPPGLAPAVLRPSEIVCGACRRELSSVNPLRPAPSVSGVPDCVAAGAYAGALRQCAVAFKDRGRPELRAQLAPLLESLVDALSPGPVVLVPVPTSRRARRRRGYCHVTLLCRTVSARVPRVSVAAVLSSLDKPDFSGLGRQQRRAAADAAMRVRGGRSAAKATRIDRAKTALLLVDDIVTSGATLAAAAAQMRNHRLMPDAAVCVAATI